MRFINNGKPVKIRLGTHREGYTWWTIRKNEKMELPERTGKIYRLEQINKVTESQIGETKVETKQFEYTPDNKFFEELTKVKGIGPKTAKDIVIWGTKEKLIESIQLKAHLPFRDDISKKLKKKYGKK